MCSSRKYPYPPPPHGSDLPYDPLPFRNSNLAPYIALNFGVFETPPSSPEFPIPSVGGVWIFSGITQCVVPENIHTPPTEGFLV